MSAARTTGDAFQDVLLALFRLHGQVLHAADVMSADAGLSGARWQVMKVVARRPMTVSQVAGGSACSGRACSAPPTGCANRGWPRCCRTSTTRVPGSSAFPRRDDARWSPCSDDNRRGSTAACAAPTRADMDALATSLADLAERVERATAREAPESARRRRDVTATGRLSSEATAQRRVIDDPKPARRGDNP